MRVISKSFPSIPNCILITVYSMNPIEKLSESLRSIPDPIPVSITIFTPVACTNVFISEYVIKSPLKSHKLLIFMPFTSLNCHYPDKDYLLLDRDCRFFINFFPMAPFTSTHLPDAGFRILPEGHRFLLDFFFLLPVLRLEDPLFDFLRLDDLRLDLLRFLLSFLPVNFFPASALITSGVLENLSFLNLLAKTPLSL